jgi:hypothetical protein
MHNPVILLVVLFAALYSVIGIAGVGAIALMLVIPPLV